MELNQLTGTNIGEAMKIHTELGPGLLESVYEEVLSYRLNKGGLQFRRQTPIPVFYEEVKMDIGFRADLIVEEKVIIEIKSVESITPVHSKIINLIETDGHYSWPPN